MGARKEELRNKSDPIFSSTLHRSIIFNSSKFSSKVYCSANDKLLFESWCQKKEELTCLLLVTIRFGFIHMLIVVVYSYDQPVIASEQLINNVKFSIHLSA